MIKVYKNKVIYVQGQETIVKSISEIGTDPKGRKIFSVVCTHISGIDESVRMVAVPGKHEFKIEG